MTRHTVFTCDQCDGPIEEWEHTYGHHALPGVAYATWEGARSSWEFCSDGCLFVWLVARLNDRVEQRARQDAYLAKQAAHNKGVVSAK